MGIYSTMRFTVAALLTALVCSAVDAQSQKALSNEHTCTHPPYKIHLVSKSPLVIYITNFVTPSEREHLMSIAKDGFTHSGVINSAGGSSLNRVRTSQSTTVERDAIVRCIESRAVDFQGFDIPNNHLEPVQLVKYGQGERYHFHTDWFTDPAHSTAALGGNRISSFFGYVSLSNITGGGTNFPMLEPPQDERWCEFIDCDEPWEAGITFRPIEGNFVYWENLYQDGTGDPRNLHAGLPVTTGEKVGMNIWTRQGPLSKEIRGE